MDDSFLGMLPMFFFVIIIYGLLGVVGLASYVLRGIGILRMSESRGLQNGWLGFIPFASEYQLGKIAGEVEFGKKTIKKPGVWLVLFPLITYGVFFVVYFALLFGMIGMADFGYGWSEPSPGAISAMVIGIVICYLFLCAGAIMICLLQGLVFHRIFSCYSDGQKPIFHMLVCLFVPLGSAILLASYGKKPMQHLPSYMTVYTQGYPNYQQYQQQYQQYQQYYYGNAQPQPPQYSQPAQPPVQQGTPPPQTMAGPEQNVGPVQPPQYGQPAQPPVQQGTPPQPGMRPEQTSEPENGGNTDQKQD